QFESFEKGHFEERERREIQRSLIAFGTWISPFGRNDKNDCYSKLSIRQRALGGLQPPGDKPRHARNKKAPAEKTAGAPFDLKTF
ncbi:MAG TPA: hypothetical protein PKK47_08980, partial [Smithellaceae bacterium]|nr:hypothetical protein [Smithellaceae bacterium]HQP06484.1 hypothetical protein [Smithellaceae bacterium]